MQQWQKITFHLEQTIFKAFSRHGLPLSLQPTFNALCRIGNDIIVTMVFEDAMYDLVMLTLVKISNWNFAIKGHVEGNSIQSDSTIFPTFSSFQSLLRSSTFSSIGISSLCFFLSHLLKDLAIILCFPFH